jgi:hypothetical protein
MGNNAAFTSFEASVIAVYNRGVLDKELLDALAAPYEGMDIDRGGMEGTLTKDGLDIDGVICKVYGIVLAPYPDIPKDWRKQTPEQQDLNDEWVEATYEAIQKIQEKWGWG